MIETLQAQIPVALTGVGAAVLRNASGWLHKALEDGKISTYEWGQLGATVVRVTMITVGLNLGLGLDAVAASASAFVADYIVQKISAGKKKK